MRQIFRRLKPATRSLLCILAVFAVLLPVAWAASSNVIIEAEQGTRSGQTSLASDSNASGGSYVSFNAAAGGPQFQETFDSAADLNNNFDHAYGGVLFPPGDPNRVDTWLGDHDDNCGGDGTYRTVHYGVTKTDDASSVYVCPLAGDPHGGHLMMSYFSIGVGGPWVSPKPFFNNVKKVCWDMNLTFIGGRTSFNMVIAAKSDIDANTARNGYYDLEFSPPGYQNISGNDSTTWVVPTAASLGVQYYRGFFKLWQQNDWLGEISGPYSPEDLSMHQLCVIDNGNNSITLTAERPGSGTLSTTIQGQSFPTGQVRVVFEFFTHNSNKDSTVEYDPHQNTYHIDNILIQ